MDQLGQRIVDDRATIRAKRLEADELEERARRLRQEADEMERLLQLARTN
ncbi:FtsZ-binding cell division protein ZapB [Bradyrhizobium sp. USDA 4341]